MFRQKNLPLTQIAKETRGVDVIHLSSCMQMENYPKCPHIDEIKKTVQDAGIKLVEGTHH